MSIKTVKQRISVVAVSALTAGLLTVASIPAANAYTNTDYASGTTGGLASVASGSSAVCSANAFDGTSLSLGADTGGTDSADLVSLTIPVGSKISMLAAATSDIVYSSGTGIFLEDLTGTTVSVNGTKFTSANAADSFFIVANAVGRGYVKNFGAGATALSTITVDVVASCSSAATWSDSTSGVETSTDSDTSPDGESGSTYTFVDADTAYISLLPKNAFGAALPAGTWVVSATGAAVVGIGTSVTPAVGATSVASVTGDGADVFVSVEQASSGTAVTTVVTISYNGATVYSRSIKFTGDLAKITVSGVDVQDIVANNLTGIYDVVAQDAAGNYLAWAVTGDVTKYGSIVTSVTGGTTNATGSGTVAATSWSCNTTSGKQTVRVKGTTNAGTTVYSNDFDALCGGAAYTYSASLDKAKYSAGDIATLTITAKDASGFAPFKGETVDAAAGTPSIAGSQMTSINAPAAADTFNSPVGQKVYTFTVGSTAGKYNMAVNLGYSGNTAISVPYEVAASGDVSNAEVLKSIVALIASINKQIQALQKLILKR
jgi:hypothetical protein